MNMKRVLLISFVLLAILTACNKDREFKNYKYTTVYFPYQSPVRTLVLGEDIFDNTLDNQHKFKVMATMGGVYENKKNVAISVEVDDALAERLRFGTPTGDSVFALPAGYYTLPRDKRIEIKPGEIMGGLEVQLTDAFFQDPRSVKNTFVLPLRITSVSGADSVLRGKSEIALPDRRKAADWAVRPKDYVLYAVKYVNPYHGTYLRRGTAEVKSTADPALDTTFIYRAQFVEKDELANLVTLSLSQNSVSLNAKNKGNINQPFRAILNFDNQGKITVSKPDTVTTYNVTGNGEFVKKGDKWGNQPRDVIRMKYQVTFGTTTHSFSDTIVLRDRGVKFETFNPVVVN
jgi:hypothetical protein